MLGRERGARGVLADRAVGCDLGFRAQPPAVVVAAAGWVAISSTAGASLGHGACGAGVVSHRSRNHRGGPSPMAVDGSGERRPDRVLHALGAVPRAGASKRGVVWSRLEGACSDGDPACGRVPRHRRVVGKPLDQCISARARGGPYPGLPHPGPSGCALKGCASALARRRVCAPSRFGVGRGTPGPLAALSGVLEIAAIVIALVAVAFVIRGADERILRAPTLGT